jgi:hypothetical protein
MRAIAMALTICAATASLGARPQTITGDVIDVQCTLDDAKNADADHVDCALSCARRGARMGILTDEGIYTIAGEYTRDNNRKLLAFVARPVEASGEVTEKDGVRVITVTSIREAASTGR